MFKVFKTGIHEKHTMSAWQKNKQTNKQPSNNKIARVQT